MSRVKVHSVEYDERDEVVTVRFSDEPTPTARKLERPAEVLLTEDGRIMGIEVAVPGFVHHNDRRMNG